MELRKRRRSPLILVAALLASLALVLSIVGLTVWYTTGSKLPWVIYVPITGQSGISAEPVTKAQIDDYKVPAKNPRYISIPELSINKARVTSVGLTASNIIDVPKNVHDTAWYNESALPGSGKGSTLINGHNQGYAEPGVFSKLATLKSGAGVTIETGDGTTVRYQVVDVRTMSLDDTARYGMKELLQPVDPAKEGLGLISCAGTFVPRLGEFNQRVLVRAIRTDI